MHEATNLQNFIKFSHLKIVDLQASQEVHHFTRLQNFLTPRKQNFGIWVLLTLLQNDVHVYGLELLYKGSYFIRIRKVKGLIFSFDLFVKTPNLLFQSPKIVQLII